MSPSIYTLARSFLARSLFNPFPAIGRLSASLGLYALMTPLTSYPSVGNYNICGRDKASHKDDSCVLFRLLFLSARPIISEGQSLLCGEGAAPITQTDMLTANTNMEKQMVHASLFRFLFKCNSPTLSKSLSFYRKKSLPAGILAPRHKGAPFISESQ